MANPTFDATKHDVSINGIGFMVANGGSVVRQDLNPATSRATVGTADRSVFETESFIAQDDWEGGMGQERLRAADSFLCGIGDSRWEGKFFPAMKVLTQADGGTEFPYVDLGATLSQVGESGQVITTAEALWGYVATASDTWQQIGTSTTVAVAGTQTSMVDRPELSGHGAALAIFQDSSSARTLHRFDGATDTSLSLAIAPNIVKRLGKWTFVLGQEHVESTCALVQEGSATVSSALEIEGSWDALTGAGNCLVAMLRVSGYTGSQTSRLFTPADPDWQFVDRITDLTLDFAVEFFILPNAPRRRANKDMERFAFASSDGSVPTTLRLNYYEVSGIDALDALEIWTTEAESQSSASSSIAVTGVSTGTLSRAKAFLFSGLIVQDSVTDSYQSATPEAGYTELLDTTIGGTPTAGFHLSYKVVSNTAAEAETKTVAMSGNAAGTLSGTSFMLVLKGSLATSDAKRFAIAVTEDDGYAWDYISVVGASGIDTPLAGVSTQGFLWFTTRRGLYRMAVEEVEYEDHQVKLVIGIQGPLDTFNVPYDVTAIGTHIAVFDGDLFYSLGATVRRLAPGGVGAQIWPPQGWAGPVGKVQALTAGEGGVYFAAGGFLYCYNGRGFHPLAVEASAGQFDVLYFYQGKLFGKGDPAPYLDFRYPSSRPDIVATAPTNFTTGYLVMSEMDFGKVNVNKVITTFELHVHWTATSDSGTVTLHYLADPTVEDPGRVGGGATSLTWTSIGSMTVADGPNKTLTLGTPITPKRLFLRATVAPGTANGYPIIESVVAYGRSVMPSLKRFVMDLDISTSVVDRAGTVLYPDDADVKAAIDALVALREASAVKYFTVLFRDEMSGTEPYVCTAEAMQDWLVGTKGDNSMTWKATFAVTEIPGG